MTPATNTPVLLQREGAVAHIVLNRPEQLNVIDVGMAQALLGVCEAVAGDAGVRAVVVRGEGRSFGGGGDLRGFGDAPQATALAIIEPVHRALRLLAAMPAPVLASLHGHVAGGSMSLALGCDLALAADDTRFHLAYGRVAASCDVGGSWHLPRLVGLRRALGIALLGDAVEAQQALDLGLINRLVPAAQRLEQTRRLAQQLADGPTIAFGRMKSLLRSAFDHDLGTQLDLERDAFHACAGTEDFREAVAAFLSRRPARFRGQ